MSLVTSLIILNVLWTLYITYIIYKRNSKKTLQMPEDNMSSNPGLESQLNKSIQKVAINRFNPYDDLGGDQSFVLALLDNSNSGVIITSLHNRDNTRVYAKPIKNGEGEGISLSQEEKSVITKAIKG